MSSKMCMLCQHSFKYYVNSFVYYVSCVGQIFSAPLFSFYDATQIVELTLDKTCIESVIDGPAKQ